MLKVSPENKNVGSFIRHCTFLACLLFLVFCLLPYKILAQETDTTTLSSKRVKWLATGSVAGYGALLTGLNILWYQKHPQTRFHFFNDNKQWMQADKAGHIYSTYHLSRTGSEAMKWAGMNRKKSAIYGSIGGFLFMLPVEILDGYSAEYGASWGDLAANSFGSLLYAGQIIAWNEVLLKPKFSFHPSSYAGLRPNVLGKNFTEQVLKDYNGQTYWLSADIHGLLPAGNNFPCWLSLALGYGTEEMIYAHPGTGKRAGFNPYPQFYLSPDPDLSKIKSKKKVIKILLFLLDGVKLPAPALEFGKNRIRFHPVYF